jgi:hypothetical protein
MSHDDERPDDPDRAAILARRKHFIALAISGLATTACAGKDETSNEAKSDVEVKTEDPRPETPPQPCLSPMMPEELPDAGETGPDETGAPEANAAETGGEAQLEAPPPKPEPETKPRVCLRRAPPKPCLKKPHDPTDL